MFAAASWFLNRFPCMLHSMGRPLMGSCLRTLLNVFSAIDV